MVAGKTEEEPEREGEKGKGKGGPGRAGRERRERARAGAAREGPARHPAAALIRSAPAGAYLPGNSWRTRRAPSWTCSPPTSSKSPTFSRAGGLGAGTPPPRSLHRALRPGTPRWPRAPSRAPAAPPRRLAAAPRARPWPRLRLRLRSGRAC